MDKLRLHCFLFYFVVLYYSVVLGGRKMIQVVLWDIDGTLLDFGHKRELCHEKMF